MSAKVTQIFLTEAELMQAGRLAIQGQDALHTAIAMAAVGAPEGMVDEIEDTADRLAEKLARLWRLNNDRAVTFGSPVTEV